MSQKKWFYTTSVMLLFGINKSLIQHHCISSIQPATQKTLQVINKGNPTGFQRICKLLTLPLTSLYVCHCVRINFCNLHYKHTISLTIWLIKKPPPAADAHSLKASNTLSVKRSQPRYGQLAFPSRQRKKETKVIMQFIVFPTNIGSPII